MTRDKDIIGLTSVSFT